MKKRVLQLFISVFMLAPALFGASVEGAQLHKKDMNPEKFECALMAAANKDSAHQDELNYNKPSGINKASGKR